MEQEDAADLYVRSSSTHRQPSTLERQEADCRDWVARAELTVRKVHRDEGRSAYRAGVPRAGLAAALAAVEAGHAKTLVVWKLDRLSRRGVTSLVQIIDQVADAGGRVVSVHDRFDSRAPEARLLLTTLAEIARAESANLGLRVQSAKDLLRRQGRWIGGAAPFGYVVVDGLLRVEPEKAAVVRRMADAVLAGTSLACVAAELNAEGVASPRGLEWGIGSISQLLRGAATAGLSPETIKRPDGSYTAQTRPWIHPGTGLPVSVLAEGQTPILSREEQAEVICALASRRWSGTGSSGSPRPWWLVGTLRCDACGGRMSRTGNSYRCQRVRLGQTCPAPAGGYQPAVDRAVEAAWLSAVRDSGPSFAAAIGERWVGLTTRNSP